MAGGTYGEYIAALEEFRNFDKGNGRPEPSYRAKSLLKSTNDSKYGKEYYGMAQEAEEIAKRYGHYDWL